MTATVASLPKIVRFLHSTDAGEYGADNCPHCGAKGRYVHHFEVEGGRRMAAMSGCIRLFPVSPVADEERKINERAKERAEKGWTLASWDTAKLQAIEAFYAGNQTEQHVLDVIRFENARRTNYMQTRRGRR